MNKILTFIWLMTAGTSVIAGESDLLVQAAADSSIWPTHLGVTEVVPAGDRVLRPGPPGVLMRVEGDRALIDFGRRGVHWVALDKTDFESRARELIDADEPQIGNYILMLGGNLGKIKDGGLMAPPAEWHTQVSGLLLVYFAPEAMDANTIDQLRQLQRQGERADEPFRIVLMPRQVFIPRDGARIAPEFSGFLIIPYPLSEAYAKAMRHTEPAGHELSLIMIDKNGMLLGTPSIESLLDPKNTN